jgi:hypothetical protein
MDQQLENAAARCGAGGGGWQPPPEASAEQGDPLAQRLLRPVKKQFLTGIRPATCVYCWQQAASAGPPACGVSGAVASPEKAVLPCAGDPTQWLAAVGWRVRAMPDNDEAAALYGVIKAIHSKRLPCGSPAALPMCYAP